MNQNEEPASCSLRLEPTGSYWTVTLLLTMTVWCNGLMGCFLCITCGVPDSWSHGFNPCKRYTFPTFQYLARYFWTMLPPFLTDMVTPFPCNLSSNLILEYLIYINLILPYQHETKLFLNKRVNQDYSTLYCNPKLDIYFQTLPGPQVITRVMLFCWCR